MRHIHIPHLVCVQMNCMYVCEGVCVSGREGGARGGDRERQIGRERESGKKD